MSMFFKKEDYYKAECERLEKDILLLKERQQLLVNIRNSVSNWDYASTEEAIESIMESKYNAAEKLCHWEGSNYDKLIDILEVESMIEIADAFRSAQETK